MDRRLYIVSYDISDPVRLRRVFQTCRAFGDHLQYSVFRAELGPRGRAELAAALDAIIDHAADQVLFIDIGPARPETHLSFSALGRPIAHPERHVTIL